MRSCCDEGRGSPVEWRLSRHAEHPDRLLSRNAQVKNGAHDWDFPHVGYAGARVHATSLLQCRPVVL